MLGFIKGDNTSELIVTVGSSTDGKAKVWNPQTGQELLPLTDHGGVVFLAGYSPDGQQIVTASQDTTIKVWNAQTGQEILTRDILVESKKRFIVRMDSEL